MSSLASEELQSFRDAALLTPGLDKALKEDHGLPLPPVLPPPPPPASQDSISVSRFSTDTLSNTVDARQALMDAIRSGTGAARLRKVSFGVGALVIEMEVKLSVQPTFQRAPLRGGQKRADAGESQLCMPPASHVAMFKLNLLLSLF